MVARHDQFGEYGIARGYFTIPNAFTMNPPMKIRQSKQKQYPTTVGDNKEMLI
jgi:hypothetical protein